MKKTISLNFNRLSIKQYQALEEYVKENSNFQLSHGNKGNSHYPYASGTPSWDYYERINLNIVPPNYIDDSDPKEKKETFNRSLKGLVDIISEFDWNFEIANNDSPPFAAIR